MAVTPSTMLLPLNTQAPHFSLPDHTGKIIDLSHYNDHAGFVVAFICNHCPFVIHILPKFNEFIQQCYRRNMLVFAINSNDVTQYPEDNEQGMKTLIEEYHIDFPYLIDQDQSVAKKYKAACTPDFYLFNQKNALVYRGQFDASTPRNNITTSGNSLMSAVNAMQESQILEQQLPSTGCNIKWSANNSPKYYIT